MVDVSSEDERISRISADLATIELVPVRDEILTGEIYLDGRQFVRCTFRDATLITRLGRFSVEGPQSMDGRVTVRVEGAAGHAHGFFARTIEAMRKHQNERDRKPPRRDVN